MQCPPRNRKVLFYILITAVSILHGLFYFSLVVYTGNKVPFLVAHISFTAAVAWYIYSTRSAENKVGEIEENLAIMNDLEYCSKCKAWRPERSHHCSRCAKCVPRMDHHCAFLNTCIGAENHANFVRLTAFSAFALIFVTISIGYFFYEFKEEHPYDEYTKSNVKAELFTLFSMALVYGVLAGYVTYFSGYHIYNIATNTTYIEREVMEEMAIVGFSCPKNPYDVGICNNFKLLMGKWYFLFLFGEKMETFAFPKTYFIKKWPPMNMRDLWDM